MADVFLAHDRLLDRPVAVKVLFPEYATDPSFVERFRREAQAAANLNHPNIVGVYDWGRQGTTYFIVMEYVDGKSLADILRTRGRSSPRCSRPRSPARWPRPSASPTPTASIHRDIKPANILVATNGTVKVADFGIARAVNAADPGEPHAGRRGHGHGHVLLARAGPGPGHRRPQRPLLPRHRHVRDASAGRPPFSGDNPVTIAYRQVHEAPLPLRQVAPDVPAGYETITGHLLAKNPVQRYSSADDVRLDLRRFREGGTVQAEAPTGIAPRWSAPPRCAAAPAVGATTAMAATPLPTASPAHRSPTATATTSRLRARAGWWRGSSCCSACSAIGGWLLYRALAEGSTAAGLAALGARPAHRRGQADRHPARPRAGRGGAADGRLRARHRLRAVAAARPGRRGVGGAAGVQPGRRAGRPAQPRRHDPAGGRAGPRLARARTAGDAAGGPQPARGHRARPGPCPRQGRQGPHRDPGGVERAGPGGRPQRRQPRPGRRRPPSSPPRASR